MHRNTGWPYLCQSGSDWSKTGQIRDFFSSDFNACQNILKSNLKNSRICPNLAQIRHHCRKLFWWIYLYNLMRSIYWHSCVILCWFLLIGILFQSHDERMFEWTRCCVVVVAHVFGVRNAKLIHPYQVNKFCFDTAKITDVYFITDLTFKNSVLND